MKSKSDVKSVEDGGDFGGQMPKIDDIDIINNPELEKRFKNMDIDGFYKYL